MIAPAAEVRTERRHCGTCGTAFRVPAGDWKNGALARHEARCATEDEAGRAFYRSHRRWKPRRKH